MAPSQKLKIGFFNINGLIGDKTFDPTFKNIIEKFDIIGISESWHTNNECLTKIKQNFPNNYLYFENARKDRHKKSKRNSGGIVLFYKESLRKIVKPQKKAKNMLWIKLDKEGLNIEKDLYIGTVYNSPISSSYTKKQNLDFFTDLQTKIASLTNNDYLIIGGDFNARTAKIPDYIDENHNEIEFLNLPNTYCIDNFKKIRNNQDEHTNSYGAQLIDFCTSTNIKILNGRTLGDFTGKYTYIGYNGLSVVDYALASENFLQTDHIQSFTVDTITSLSDHRPISLQLQFKFQNLIQPTPITIKRPSRIKLENIETYKHALVEEMSAEKLLPVMIALDETNGTKYEINSITKSVTSLYTNAAQKINKNMILRKKIKHKNKNKTPWYNNECITLKRKLNQIAKSLDKTPTNTPLRIHFYTTQKAYKKVLKRKKRQYQEQLTFKMEDLYHKDKNEFWKFLKNMKTNTKDEKLPELDSLIDHFTNLYTNEEATSDLTNTIHHPEVEATDKFEILNEVITEKEVKENINKLKNKKSPGFDQLSNEMIKCTNVLGTTLLTKVFNLVLKSGHFPDDWNLGLIRLIHKGNEINDPNNYRGITLNSCLGKLFCKVLSNRLAPKLEEYNVYCKEQAGFRKNQRTTDHIYLLHRIIRKYISQNQYLYTCFVDFSKAFDSLWRLALMKKLSDVGIHGNFLNIIKSIYSTTMNSIIYENTLSPVFPSNVGVKQGDTLSTLLFNIYVNDLPSIFSFIGNHPITINNSNISCLMYADDLIIMSTSHEALQKCLHNLEDYCDKWKLEVNMKKTKILTFNKQGSLIKRHTFSYKGNTVERVKEYKYLGFTFTISGSAMTGISTLIKQAKKVWFTIQNYLFKSKYRDIDTYLSLFESQVKPILLYACEAWSDSLKEEATIAKFLIKNPIETFHLKTLKQLLGVHKKTANLAILGELGRQPVITAIKYQTIKYFLRLTSMNPQALIKSQYEEEKKLLAQNEKCFLIHATSILDQHGLTYIWRNHINKCDKQQVTASSLKVIKQRLEDMTSQRINEETYSNANSKLFFLGKIKNTFSRECYLKINNFENRRAISKLRTSSHDLQIETGRWRHIDRSARLCTKCNQNAIEDETHMVFDCTFYNDIRNEAFNYITTRTQINLFNNNNRFRNLKMLFSSKILSALNAFGKFVKRAFESRNA